MRIVDLYPPITAGALLAAIWLAVTYKIVKRDTPGKEGWLQILWFLGSILSVGGYVLFHLNEPAGYLGVVLTTVFSVSLAGAIIFVGTRIVLNKGLPPYPRLFFGFSLIIALITVIALPNL